MSKCSKLINRMKEKLDSISGLDDDEIYGYLSILEKDINLIVKSIEKYADENELNGTCFK